MRSQAAELEEKLKFITEKVPTRICQVMGSNAGAGSGEFHMYRMVGLLSLDTIETVQRAHCACGAEQPLYITTKAPGGEFEPPGAEGWPHDSRDVKIQLNVRHLFHAGTETGDDAPGPNGGGCEAEGPGYRV